MSHKVQFSSLQHQVNPELFGEAVTNGDLGLLAYGAGGEGGIRTPDTVARMPHFECGAFNRSATSPKDHHKEQTISLSLFYAQGLELHELLLG